MGFLILITVCNLGVLRSQQDGVSVDAAVLNDSSVSRLAILHPQAFSEDVPQEIETRFLRVDSGFRLSAWRALYVAAPTEDSLSWGRWFGALAEDVPRVSSDASPDYHWQALQVSSHEAAVKKWIDRVNALSASERPDVWIAPSHMAYRISVWARQREMNPHILIYHEGSGFMDELSAMFVRVPFYFTEVLLGSSSQSKK